MHSPAEVDTSTLVELLTLWRASPATFVSQALGATPEPWQHDALDALTRHNRIAIRSGHGIGKSTLLAWLLIWFGVTRRAGKNPATAPTSHQLEDVLLSECRKWIDRMRARGWGHITRQISVTQDAIRFPTQTFAALRTATKDRPEALQGFHADDLLFLLDEASGIEDVIFEVAQALRAAGLVHARKEGLRVYYGLAGDDVVALYSALHHVAENRVAEVEKLVRTWLRNKDEMEPVPPAELMERAAKGLVVVIDVRPPEEYAAGHVPGAINVPIDQLESRLAKLPRSK